MAAYATAEEAAIFAHEFGALSSSTLLLGAASRLFDKHCEVRDDFFAAATGNYTSRDFFGDGTAYLKLDPYVALNPVDPITIDPDFDYEIPEYTEIDGSLIVLSRTKLQSPEAASYPHRFTGWRDGVKVTVSANWGFSAVPDDVKLAVIHLALHLWRTADPAFATITNSEGQAVAQRTIPAIAQDIIDRYREKYSRRALFA